MTVRGVIFDLGSTLMYFDGDWEDVVSRGVADMMAFFRRQRVKLDESALAEAFIAERRAGREVANRTRREVTCTDSLGAALQSVGGPPEAFRLLAEAVRVYFGPEEDAWKAYPDARGTLQQLHGRGLRLGLLSNATDDPFIQRLVNRLGLRPWLSPTFSSSGLGPRKPSREPFDLILSRWDLPAESVIMVGDTLGADILGAHDTGMRGVLVTANESRWNDEERGRIIPDATISTLSELPFLIEAWRDGSAV